MRRFIDFIQKSVAFTYWRVSSVFLNLYFVTRGYLELEIALSQDQISKYADKILLYTNTCMKELRRLFLVQDLVDSLKVCLRLVCLPFSITIKGWKYLSFTSNWTTFGDSVRSALPLGGLFWLMSWKLRRQTSKHSGNTCTCCQTCRLQRLLLSVCVSVCCFDVAADLCGRSLQRADTAHPRWGYPDSLSHVWSKTNFKAFQSFCLLYVRSSIFFRRLGRTEYK